MDTNDLFEKEDSLKNEISAQNSIVENREGQEDDFLNKNNQKPLILTMFIVLDIIYAVGFGVAFMLRLMFMGFGGREAFVESIFNMGIAIFFLIIFGILQLAWFTSKRNLWMVLTIVFGVFLAPILIAMFTMTDLRPSFLKQVSNSYEAKIEKSTSYSEEDRLMIALSSNLVVVKECLINKGYLLNPESNKNICKNVQDLEKHEWADVNDVNGKWGGCKFSIERLEGAETKTNISATFQYCVTLSSGEIIRCTEKGCHNMDEFIEEESDDCLGEDALTTIKKTVPESILCNDDTNRTLQTPRAGQLICRGGMSDGKWPDISLCGAKWGGCQFIERINQTNFKYCATLSSGEVVKCSQSGCMSENISTYELDTSGWIEYINKEEGYKISFPEEFIVEGGHNIINYDINDLKYDRGNPDGIKIQIQKHELHSMFNSMEDYKQYLISPPNPDQIDSAKMTGFDNDVSMYQYTKKGPGGALMMYFAFDEKNNIHYNILIFEPGYSKNKDLVELIIKTFVISQK